MFAAQLADGRRRKRHPATQQLIRHDAKRVQIGAMIDGGAFEHLRRHVRRSTEHQASIEPRPRGGHSKVEHLDDARAGEEHIAGFEIEVHDLSTVNVGQRLCHANQQVQDRLPPVFASGVEDIAPVDIVEGEEVLLGALNGFEVIDGSDVGMLELRHGSKLGLEKNQLRTRNVLMAYGLQRQRSLLMQGIADTIDDAHAAFADDILHSVAPVHAAANRQMGRASIVGARRRASDRHAIERRVEPKVVSLPPVGWQQDASI